MIAEMDNKPEVKRYLYRIMAAMVLYGLSIAGAEVLVERHGVEGIAAFALAAIPGLCLAAIFWIFARLVVEERDEFLRLLYVRQIVLSTGIALTAAAVWGFFEKYHLVPHIEAFWWPTMWCFGIGIAAAYNHLLYRVKDAEQ